MCVLVARVWCLSIFYFFTSTTTIQSQQHNEQQLWAIRRAHSEGCNIGNVVAGSNQVRRPEASASTLEGEVYGAGTCGGSRVGGLFDQNTP